MAILTEAPESTIHFVTFEDDVVIKSDLWPDQHRKRVLHTAVSQRVVAGRRAARRAAGGRPAGGRRAASGLGRRPTAYDLPKSVCVPVGVHDVVNNSELE